MQKSNSNTFSQALGFIALTCVGSTCIDSRDGKQMVCWLLPRKISVSTMCFCDADTPYKPAQQYHRGLTKSIVLQQHTSGGNPWRNKRIVHK